MLSKNKEIERLQKYSIYHLIEMFLKYKKQENYKSNQKQMDIYREAIIQKSRIGIIYRISVQKWIRKIKKGYWIFSKYNKKIYFKFGW